jgi:N-acetylated-alpha-linked acidic dipeptidase
MKKYIPLLLIFAITKLSAQTITGFSPNNTASQIQAEQKFDAQLNAQHIGETIKLLSSKPHNLGSSGSKAVAEEILRRYQDYGFDAHIETVHRIISNAKNKSAGNDRSNNLQGIIKRTCIKRRCHLRPGRPVANVQCIQCRRRCYRGTGICELWFAR